MTSAWNKFVVYAGATFDIAPTLVASLFTVISRVDGLVTLVSYVLVPIEPDALDFYLTLSELLWSIRDRDGEFQRLGM